MADETTFIHSLTAAGLKGSGRAPATSGMNICASTPIGVTHWADLAKVGDTDKQVRAHMPAPVPRFWRPWEDPRTPPAQRPRSFALRKVSHFKPIFVHVSHTKTFSSVPSAPTFFLAHSTMPWEANPPTNERTNERMQWRCSGRDQYARAEASGVQDERWLG